MDMSGPWWGWFRTGALSRLPGAAPCLQTSGPSGGPSLTGGPEGLSHHSSATISLLSLLSWKVRKQHFPHPTPGALFRYFPGPLNRGGAGSLSFYQSPAQLPGCGWLGPSWPPMVGPVGACWEDAWVGGGESWLPGASPGAEQRGHFRRPLCLPLYPEEWLQLCRVQSHCGP